MIDAFAKLLDIALVKEETHVLLRDQVDAAWFNQLADVMLRFVRRPGVTDALWQFVMEELARHQYEPAFDELERALELAGRTDRNAPSLLDAFFSASPCRSGGRHLTPS